MKVGRGDAEDDHVEETQRTLADRVDQRTVRFVLHVLPQPASGAK